MTISSKFAKTVAFIAATVTHKWNATDTMWLLLINILYFYDDRLDYSVHYIRCPYSVQNVMKVKHGINRNFNFLSLNNRTQSYYIVVMCNFAPRLLIMVTAFYHHTVEIILIRNRFIMPYWWSYFSCLGSPSLLLMKLSGKVTCNLFLDVYMGGVSR